MFHSAHQANYHQITSNSIDLKNQSNNNNNPSSSSLISKNNTFDTFNSKNSSCNNNNGNLLLLQSNSKGKEEEEKAGHTINQNFLLDHHQKLIVNKKDSEVKILSDGIPSLLGNQTSQGQVATTNKINLLQNTVKNKNSSSNLSGDSSQSCSKISQNSRNTNSKIGSEGYHSNTQTNFKIPNTPIRNHRTQYEDPRPVLHNAENIHNKWSNMMSQLPITDTAGNNLDRKVMTNFKSFGHDETDSEEEDYANNKDNNTLLGTYNLNTRTETSQNGILNTNLSSPHTHANNMTLSTGQQPGQPGQALQNINPNFLNASHINDIDERQGQSSNNGLEPGLPPPSKEVLDEYSVNSNSTRNFNAKLGQGNSPQTNLKPHGLQAMPAPINENGPGIQLSAPPIFKNNTNIQNHSSNRLIDNTTSQFINHKMSSRNSPESIQNFQNMQVNRPPSSMANRSQLLTVGLNPNMNTHKAANDQHLQNQPLLTTANAMNTASVRQVHNWDNRLDPGFNSNGFNSDENTINLNNKNSNRKNNNFSKQGSQKDKKCLRCDNVIVCIGGLGLVSRDEKNIFVKENIYVFRTGKMHTFI